MTAEGGWRDLQPPARPVSLESSPFTRLTVTHALSVAGDTLVTMALAGSLFFSISPNAARGKVTLSLVLTMAPFAVVAPFLGPAIDRSRRGRRFMVVGSCLGRAVVGYLMARVLHELWLFPAAFAALVLSKAYAVAKTSLVPAAVTSDDELVEANAKLAIVGVLAGFAAAVPGVVALKLLGAQWALYLSAVIFVAAGVFGVRVEDTRAARPVGPNRAPVGGPIAGAGAEARAAPETEAEAEPTPPAVEHRPGQDVAISSAAAAMALLRALVGFLTFLVAFGFRHRGAPSWWFGVVLAASMAGSLLASGLAAPIRRVVREEALIGACLAVVAVASVVIARLHGALWAAAAAAVVGTAASLAKLAFDALVQRDAPAHAQGRSFARFEAGFQMAWVTGALLPVVVTTPLSRGYDVMAVAAFLATIAYVGVRRLIRRASLNPSPA